jgi:hypothetical protein
VRAKQIADPGRPLPPGHPDLDDAPVNRVTIARVIDHIGQAAHALTLEHVFDAEEVTVVASRSVLFKPVSPAILAVATQQVRL